ncbi:MAG: hypothetical protein ABR572_06435 [Cryomorphaceae bacterium]
MIKLLHGFILLLTAATASYGQIISSFYLKTPKQLKEYIDRRDEFCAFPEGQWLNSGLTDPEASMRGKLTVIQYGSFDNTYSNHNMGVLAQLQKSFPEITALHVNNPKFGFPKDSAAVSKFKELWDVPLPIFLDVDFESWECNSIETWPTTLFISPSGKILDRIEGALDYRSLELALPEFLRVLKMTEKVSSTPTVSVKPSSMSKRPLLEFPHSIEKNDDLEMLFISDFSANRIWVISPTGDVMYVIGSGDKGDMDGTWATASFNGPAGLAWDEEANALYVADHRNHRIRKVHFAEKKVTTFLGNGLPGKKGDEKVTANSGSLGFPTHLALNGHNLYIARGGAAQIWKCDLRTTVAERIAGDHLAGFADGKAKEALLSQPAGMAMDKTGVLFFADAQSSAVRSLENGAVKTIAGTGLFESGFSDGRQEDVAFRWPAGVTIYDEELYIADAFNHSIRVFDPFKVRSSTLSGTGEYGYQNGPLSQARFFGPIDVVELNGVLYVTDPGNSAIRAIDLNKKTVKSIALYNYGEIAQTSSPVITDVKDLETIEVQDGNNIFDLSIDLGDAYEFDLAGYSNMGVSSRNDTLYVRSNNMEEGKVTLDYQLESDAMPTNLVLDFHLYFREKERPEKQYYRGITYIIPVVRSENPSGSSSIEINFAPDAVSGGPVMPADGQRFME